MTKSWRPAWKLKSCWAIRSASKCHGNASTAAYLLEHVVTVSGGPLRLEVVAKFIHSISKPRPRGGGNNVMRGGIVSLTIRKGRGSGRIDAKPAISKLIFKLRRRAISPQSRSTLSGNTSPVVAPLALSVSNPGIAPLVPAPDAAKENVGTAPALPSPAAILPDQSCIKSEGSACSTQLSPDADAAQTTTWLRAGRFNAFETTFASFSASDIMRLSRDDLIQICGLADGIRLFNALHTKPKLTLYFLPEENGSLWRVAYLDSLTSSALMNKLLHTMNMPHDRLHSVLFVGPQGIHVLVTDELVANMKDESMYFVETIKDNASERYKLLLKPSTRS